MRSTIAKPRETKSSGGKRPPRARISPVAVGVLATLALFVAAGSARAATAVRSPTASADLPATATLKPFGYEIFQGRVREIAEGPVDEDYLVGPRDELLIETWGEYTKQYPVRVSEDGYIDLEAENLRIFVNGLTLRQVKKEVTRQLAGIHANIFNWKNPTESKAWVSIKPMRVRNILVYVAGEVVRPGTFSISSAVSSLINVLTNAGGVKPTGSLRHIRISRLDGSTEEYDFYDFLIHGETKCVKTRLRYGETVFVDLKRKSVAIYGRVRRPAIYEMVEGESLRDLLDFAGGPAPGAYLKRIQVVRRAINKGTQTIDVDFAGLEESGTTFPLMDGDVVQVFPAVEEEYVVSIEGAGVYRPGTYQFIKGMTLADLIEKAEGLRGEACLKKADLIRTRIDYTKEYRSFSLEKLYRKNPKTGKVELIGDKSNPANFALQRLDKVVIYSYYDIIGRDKKVRLEGHVKEPGEYLLADNLKLSDLLFAHGGFEDPDWRRATYLDRADLIRTMPEDLATTIIAIPLRRVLDGDPTADIELQSMDRIIVYSYDEIKKKEKFVTLEGHVKKPGKHPLSENMRLSDLFFAYGGFEDEDFRKATYLDRADLYRTSRDGLSVRVIPINIRKVLEGDPAADIRLQSLDRIVVYEYKDFFPDSYFTVHGAVRRPGRYLLAENTTLSDAIVMARGLLDEAYKYEAEIVRTLPARVSLEEPAQVIRVPISENYATMPRDKDFRIMKDDAIFIRTVPGWEKPRRVRIEGEICFPGEYILAKAEERISDLVKRAGNLKETAYLPGAVFTRLLDKESTASGRVRVVIDLARALEHPGGSADLILRNGDRLFVPINPMTVEVRGAVRRPAVIQYRKGRGMSYYIARCGGFRGDALKRDTLLVNPDGTATRRGWGLFEPKPLPGSVILVPPYEEAEAERAGLAGRSPTLVATPLPTTVPLFPRAGALPVFPLPAGATTPTLTVAYPPASVGATSSPAALPAGLPATSAAPTTSTQIPPPPSRFPIP